MKSEKQTLRMRALLNIAYTVSELVYLIERRWGDAPDPEMLHRNLSDITMYEWMRRFLGCMPDNYEFMDDRTRVFKAYMYGCNPAHVADAIRLNKNTIRYCFRFKDGIL